MSYPSEHRIGPNAIIRVAEALRDELGHSSLTRVFAAAGLERYLETLPEQMVDEREVTRLHEMLRRELGIDTAAAISWTAGLATAEYLLAHRIPQGAQRLLHILPPGIAARLLLPAIAKHSWTFSGSGTFHYLATHPSQLSIIGCPICQGGKTDMPMCHYYTATFQQLFTKLVSKRCRAQEISCQAHGAAPSCTFEIRWR